MYGFFIILSNFDVYTHSYFSLFSYWHPKLVASALWDKEKQNHKKQKNFENLKKS